MSRYFNDFSDNKITVHNINENGNDRTPNGFKSWKDYWEDYTNRKFNKCSCCESADAEVGAHVQKSDSYDRRWYIVPLCIGCNNKRGQDIQVRESDLVPVNQ